MKSEILLRVLDERIEELKEDIKEFTIMELEATSEKEKITYGVKLAQTRDLLMVTIEGIERVKESKKIHDEIKIKIDKLRKELNM